MKIFVSYPDDNKASTNATFNQAVEYLKKLGHNVKQDIEFRKSLKENDDKTYEAFQTKVEKSIKDADIVLVEVSNADSKIGFDVARALGEKKVVIALEKENKSAPLQSVIHGNTTRTLIHKRYTDKNINDVVAESLNDAKSKLDTKFILIISPEIDRYLDWASGTKRMHKAQIVRNSIEAAMKKDKEYKAYLE